MLALLRYFIFSAFLFVCTGAYAQSLDSLIIQGKKLVSDGCNQW
jgi:hypothetical protein